MPAAWSVPKGEYTPEEEPMAAARREFEEELGLAPPEGDWLPLGEARQPGGKIVTVWALEGDLDTDLVVPGTFTMEWPQALGPYAGVPRDRPGRVDRHGRGEGEAGAGSAGLPRPAGGAARYRPEMTRIPVGGDCAR